MITYKYTKQVIVAFALLSCLLLLPACGDYPAEQEDTTTTATQETTSETAVTEPTEESADGQIRVSKHYYYMLPEGFEEVEADYGDEFKNQRGFVSGDGVCWIRSFADEQVNYPFPGIIEAVFKGKTADIEYQEFIFDEPIFRIKHPERDEQGNRIHVTSLVWMDGADDLCWIDIVSSKDDPTETEEQIFDTIGLYGSIYDYVDIPGQDASAFEEHDLDEIMMREAEQAMKEQYEKDMRKQMEDMFGRMPY